MKYKQISQQFGKEEIYHICFAVYKNKWLLVGIYKDYISQLIVKISEERNIKIYIYKIMPNHIHVLLLKKNNQLIPQIVQFIKGKIAFYFFQKFREIKIDLHSNHLWKAGYWAVKINNKQQFNNAYFYIKNNDNKLKYKINSPGL